MGRSLVASSAFTGETTGNTPANFTALNPLDGSITIDTERVETNTSSQTLDARWTGSGTFGADQYAKLTVSGLSNPGGLNQMGVILRASGDTEGARDCYRVFVLEDNTTAIRIEKVLNGSVSVLNTTNVASFGNLDTVEAEVDGTSTATIRSYRNGTLVATVTDSTSPLTSGQPGITARLEFGPGLFGDNWEAGNLAATLTADAGTFTLTGQDASLSENLATANDIGGLVIGSSTAFVGEGYVGANEAAPAGSPYTLTADHGAFTLTGQAATTRQGYVLTAAAGSFTLTGSDAVRDLAISAASGSFTLTGQDATLSESGADPVLTADAGSFTLTGQAAVLQFGHVMPAAAGSFALTGIDTTLQWDQTLAADAGLFTLTGQAATLRFGHVLTAAAGSYSLTGQDATLTPSGAPASLTADAGAFTLTGQDATLRAARQMVGASGAFTLTGQAATLLTAHRIAADAGSFTLTGQDATLTPDVAAVLTAESGTFTLTGAPADLIAPSASTPIGVGSGGGGGGGIWYQGQKKRAKRKTLGDLANRLIDETLAEELYRDIRAAGEGETVAKAVKPHAESRAAEPPPEAIDWDALARDAAAVGALLQTWRRIERQREIDEDDEDWLLM